MTLNYLYIGLTQILEPIAAKAPWTPNSGGVSSKFSPKVGGQGGDCVSPICSLKVFWTLIAQS